MSETSAGTSAATIAVTRLPHGADLPLPAYATEDAAGMDLVAAIAEDLVLVPGASALVPTGLAMAIPAGFEVQVRPRSGLALKSGVTVLNTPGTVDADYRGEVGVILINHSRVDFTIARGMRIAQMVVAPVTRATWQEVETLPDSARGTGGFGSTGTTAAGTNVAGAKTG